MLTDQFGDALMFAEKLHRTQQRKGTDIPYVAHLLAVCSLVLEHGGDETQAIAALLHDAVEDQGGDATLVAIREQFGEAVARIVADCTDAWDDPKPDWRVRKEAYLAMLPNSHVRRSSSRSPTRLTTREPSCMITVSLERVCGRVSPAAGRAHFGTTAP
jgi:(p)ppGpp synthase/HD superfamily hydrolase